MLNLVDLTKLLWSFEPVGLGFVAVAARDCESIAKDYKKQELRPIRQSGKPLAFGFNLRHGEGLTLELSDAGGVRLERVIRAHDDM